MKRTLWIGAAAAAAIAWSAGSALAQETVTFSSWGGAYQEALTKAMIEPAEKKLGIKVKQDNLTGLAPVKSQVLSGKVFWDVVDLGVTDCQRGAVDGIFQELDYSLIPAAKDLPKSDVHKNWVGLLSFSTVIAWNKDVVKGDGPKNWAEFWDVKKFPGKRAMRNLARESLEQALMADGVAPDKLYPLDVDRAYKKLEQLKPHLVFWTSGGQSAQMLKDGEAEYVAIWNGRAAALKKDGVKVDMHYNQALYLTECLAVPKGAPNPKAAMKFINEMIMPEPQANLPKHIDYGPVNPKAYQTGIITPEMAKNINSHPDNMKTQAVINPEWWSTKAGEDALARWAAFVQK
jgi:putative spermidine/putrescine transport system substrate-binding protein